VARTCQRLRGRGPRRLQFGPLDELRETAHERLQVLQRKGEDGARLYLSEPEDGVGDAGAFFLLLDELEVYGLPPDPVDTTRDLKGLWATTLIAAGAVLAGVYGACAGPRS